jgi:hypothetical protein
MKIFSKYNKDEWPTNCSHDVFFVAVDPSVVTDEEKSRLKDLEFIEDEDSEGFISFHFGSC